MWRGRQRESATQHVAATPRCVPDPGPQRSGGRPPREEANEAEPGERAEPQRKARRAHRAKTGRGADPGQAAEAAFGSRARAVIHDRRGDPTVGPARVAGA